MEIFIPPSSGFQSLELFLTKDQAAEKQFKDSPWVPMIGDLHPSLEGFQSLEFFLTKDRTAEKQFKHSPWVPMIGNLHPSLAGFQSLGFFSHSMGLIKAHAFLLLTEDNRRASVLRAA